MKNYFSDYDELGARIKKTLKAQERSAKIVYVCVWWLSALIVLAGIIFLIVAEKIY